MKQLLNLSLSLFALFCILTDLPAQTYYPSDGMTIYKTQDGNLVLYIPENTGSKIWVLGKDGKKLQEIDCEERPNLCKGALEDASDGKTPDLPQKPADGEGDEDPTTSTQISKELMRYSQQNKGKMYFRSNSGKWSVVEDWQTMHKNIMASVNKR